MPRGCDVVVHGGGVAGSTVAILLARSGVRVVQHAAIGSARDTPPEILSPGSRALLHRLGLPEPEVCSQCDGVLSLWGGQEPDLHDYVLMSGSAAPAIQREALRDALGVAARATGVIRLARDRATLDETAPPIGQAPYRVLAIGRSGAADRADEDRLVALFLPCLESRPDPRLILETAPEGWWYLPPGSTHRTLVFVTAPDLIPPGRAARAAWLTLNFEATRLIAPAAGKPRFDRVTGVDARVVRAKTIDWPGGVYAGDAALSLDPLSGTGIARALEGGAVLADDILAHGSAGEAYREWVERTHAKESMMRAALYGRAGDQFPTGRFWHRARKRPDG